MIQLKSLLKVADNSGAKEVMVINIFGGHQRRVGSLGDTFVGTVKKADPHGTVRAHQIVYGVVIRTTKEVKRVTGEHIRFDENACALIDNKTKEPIGTVVFGPVAREVKERGFNKIASLAPEVI
jgi:large subunit ribosomal protein L14